MTRDVHCLMRSGSGGVPTRQRGAPKRPAVLGWVAAAHSDFLRFAVEPEILVIKFKIKPFNILSFNAYNFAHFFVEFVSMPSHPSQQMELASIPISHFAHFPFLLCFCSFFFSAFSASLRETQNQPNPSFSSSSPVALLHNASFLAFIRWQLS